MTLQASDFEFKNRFWIFGGLFWIAFASYWVSRPNASGAALVDWLVRGRGNAPELDYHLVFGVAALFCLAAAAIRTWATAYLKPEVMVDSQLHTSEVVADGPYRYVRNPLYFGNILLAIGFGSLSPPIGFVILVGGMIFFDYRLILREEAGILASQGERFRVYCAAVPRLLPSPLPKLPAGGITPKWGDGFLGEAFMWTMAFAVVVFAFTLSQVAFFVVLGAAFVVHAICVVIITRRRKQKTAGAP
jgi:protein-S-isoprenylcysteine O-methyltransferase Ste14